MKQSAINVEGLSKAIELLTGAILIECSSYSYEIVDAQFCAEFNSRKMNRAHSEGLAKELKDTFEESFNRPMTLAEEKG